ncbi:MAG: gamma-glutamyl-gamma-aminobutyrate hydrolase family protein [Acidimicrobiales bacterium]|nr:gamma-glutamyl-gamma-aminobutyrate hydrolase family protein [Acidimicrobiales bacterium]
MSEIAASGGLGEVRLSTDPIAFRTEAGPGSPVIAVTGRVIAAERVERALEPQAAVPTYYLEALGRAGAVGVVLLPNAALDEAAADLMARFDGLVLTGGDDLDPGRYGEAPVPETYGFSAAIDAWEEALYLAAVELGRPVLAICRGLQLVNVAHGGTLRQHITGTSDVAHGVPLGGGGSDVEIAVEADSRLVELLGGERSPIGRCHHHQAVGLVGEGLRVTARAADGCVEGLEPDSGEWVVAVQWHPEDSAGRDPVQQRLFDGFVAACREVPPTGAHRPG